MSRLRPAASSDPDPQAVTTDEQTLLLRLWRTWPRPRRQAFLRFMLETSAAAGWDDPSLPRGESPENLNKSRLLRILGQIQQGNQGVAEHRRHLLERLEVGIELALKVAAHPRLVFADAIPEVGLRHLGRLEPLPEALARTVFVRGRHHVHNR